MKKSLLLAGAVFAAVFMTGCFSANTNDAAVSAKVRLEHKRFSVDIQPGKDKVFGEASLNSLFGFINWGVSEFADDAFVGTEISILPIKFASAETLVKQGATYKACERAGADYILGAKYRIDTKDYIVFKQIKCRVTGYPAYLKGIK